MLKLQNLIILLMRESLLISLCGTKFTRVDRAGSNLSRLDRFLPFEGLLDDIIDISCIALN